MRLLPIVGSLLALFVVVAGPGRSAEEDWIDLSKLEAWKGPTGDWFLAESVEVDPQNPRKLVGKPGKDILVNGPKGSTKNLLSKQSFQDVEAHVEFLIPKGSNSGVKFLGLYEIQITDSAHVKEPKGHDCGGIYPRAEILPKYHHIDDGFPPKTNAAKGPGEWQTLDVVFKAPRFDESGKKTSNAKFVKVTLNGKVIHEDVEVAAPTGAAWRLLKETPTGPLLLQADHGPVAFRNVKVKVVK
jgi:hypothetical protein